MSRFVNSRLAELEAYTPGEQPTDKKYIKLNTNESPYPPSPEVTAAVAREAAELRLYPDPTCGQLRRSLAERYGVSDDEVFVSNGSDDILNFAFMAFFRNEKGVAFADITYGFYKVFAALHGIKAKIIPLNDDFTLPVQELTSCGCGVVIANPNAPTGIALLPCEIEKVIAANRDNVVIVDEAYVDFGAESVLPLIKMYDNLLVVRTYSKSRSMAGARLGFAFGQRELIADLEKLKYSTNPYDINRMTQKAGIAALENDGYYADKAKEIAGTRERVRIAMLDMGFEVTESRANFLFARYPGFAGDELYRKLRENGILVRYFGGERIHEYLRITVGSTDEMQKLLAAFEKILSEKGDLCK